MPLDFPNPSNSTTYTDPTSGNTYTYANGSWSLTSILSATKGGTGFASFNRGDILYGNASGTLSKLGAGTAGSVLSTNGTGADPTWIAMTSGGGAGTVAVPSAASLFSYYSSTGASVKATANVEYTDSSSVLMTITGKTTAQQSLKVVGNPNSSSVPIFSVDGSSGSQFLVINSVAGQDGIVVAISPSSASATWAFLVNNSSGDTRFQVDTKDNKVQLKKGTQLELYEVTGNYYTAFKATSATANTVYTLPPTSPSAGSSVLQSDTSGLLSWVSMSTGGGAGTVATPGSSGKLAYYASTGASVKDATGLDYAASTNIFTVTSQNTTDVVLQLKGLSSSQTGSAIVYKKDGTNNSFVVDKDGYVSTGEWRSTVVSTTYGGTGQNTYTDGQLLIGNSSGNTLTKSTLTAGIGISIVNGNGSITVNNFRPVVLNLASGFTPVGIGTDYNILRVPEGKNNTSASYNIRKVVMGVGTTSSGTSTIRVEKSIGPHTSTSGFNLASTGSTWNAMSADLSLLSGLGETSWITFTSGYGTAATGDRIRLNFTAVDSTHANFIVQVLLEEY
jgi:hypothetical protein